MTDLTKDLQSSFRGKQGGLRESRPDLSEAEDQDLDAAVKEQADEVFRWPVLTDEDAVRAAVPRLAQLTAAELAQLEVPPKRYFDRMAEVVGLSEVVELVGMLASIPKKTQRVTGEGVAVSRGDQFAHDAVMTLRRLGVIDEAERDRLLTKLGEES